MAVDAGGTFTDVVVADAAGIRTGKVPSRPDAPDEAVAAGVTALLGDEAPLADAEFVGHGTTRATNAVLEETWAEAALVTTAGMRDVLAIGRGARPSLYDLDAERPPPIVPRDRRFTVPERLDADGEVVEPLDEAAAREVAAEVAAADPAAVAVCCLFAYANPDHEERVCEYLRDAGVDVPIVRSSDVHPEIREYERTLTTALNAALVPVVGTYVDRLAAWAAGAGLDGDLAVVRSDGGLMTAAATLDRPVETLLSGPAAGVRGAAAVAQAAGIDDCVTLDMGGTSCDVSLVTGGDLATSRTTEVGEYPVGVPSVDVHTVGAGGGSIAWVDEGGALRVGPRSAGADPGPVCYDRGGTEPTVTDAQVVLGRIDPGTFDGDADREDAAQAVLDGVGETVEVHGEVSGDGPVSAEAIDAARGIVDVATASMARAIRVVTVERGHDPRERALVAFGGAGPVHATALAAAVGMERVLLPARAGVLSAVGILATDEVATERVSRVTSWAAIDPGTLADTMAGLRRDAGARLSDPDDALASFHVDLRYDGQAHELRIPVDVEDEADIDGDALDRTADRFHERHRERYGHAAPEEPIELVTVRVRVRRPVEPPDLRRHDPGTSLGEARVGRRPVWFDGRQETPVYDWAALPAGADLDGPAIVAADTSTALLRPSDAARVLDDGSLRVEVGDA